MKNNKRIAQLMQLINKTVEANLVVPVELLEEINEIICYNGKSSKIKELKSIIKVLNQKIDKLEEQLKSKEILLKKSIDITKRTVEAKIKGIDRLERDKSKPAYVDLI